jgi:hypothetical protein
VRYFRGLNTSFLIEPPSPRRRRAITQGLRIVEVIPLKHLDIILVLALAEAREGLPRVVLALEEVDS